MSYKVHTTDTQSIEIFELHPREMELMRLLRNKMKFGEVTIVMRNGLPQYVKRVLEIETLDSVQKKDAGV